MGNNQSLWKNVKEAPSFISLYRAAIVRWNSDEFIVATPLVYKNGAIPGFYIFNVINKQWRQWMKYPSEWDRFVRKMIYDPERKLLYLWTQNANGHPKQMRIINVNTKQEIDVQHTQYHNQYFVNVENTIHLIGSQPFQHQPVEAKYRIFDKATNEFQLNDCKGLDQKCHHELLCVYVAVKDMILLLGTHSENENQTGSICKYCVNTGTWKEIQGIDYKYCGGLFPMVMQTNTKIHYEQIQSFQLIRSHDITIHYLHLPYSTMCLDHCNVIYCSYLLFHVYLTICA